MNWSALPKVELHLHLDCSLSYEVVCKFEPEISKETYNDQYKAPFNCNNLLEYIERAERAIRWMQTPEQLRLVTLDLFKQLKEDGVIYAEMRFAPLQHLRSGLSAEEVVEAVCSATEEGKHVYGIEAGIILCTLRHYTEAQSMQTVQLAEKFGTRGVVGIDIAADEVNFSLDAHISAFAYARERGINITAHAGEAAGASSVWQTLEQLKPSRIGHGVRSMEDASLIEHLKANDIHLEVCPTSNCHTKVCQSYAEHPVNQLYKQDVSISINTDGRTISDISLSNEFGKLHSHFGWEKAQWYQVTTEAIRHSFASSEIKNRLLEKVNVHLGNAA
jgi:adenosine deaminase